MMKKSIIKRAGRTFLLLLPLLLGSLSVQAADYTYNNLYFNLDVSTRTATLTYNNVSST